MSYYLQPIFLIGIGVSFFKEHVSLKKMLYILLACIGVLLTSEISIKTSSNMILGICFALLAGLLYSFVPLLMRKVVGNFYVNIFIQLAVGAIALLPFISKIDINASTILCLTIIGTIHTALAYLMFYQGINKVNITTIAVISYLDPIIAIFTDVIFFNRHLSIIQILGICLTFISVFIIIRLK